jgi:hypothetical protein
MNSLDELLAQHAPLGSAAYYRTLFLKEDKHQIQILFLLHDTINKLLYCSVDADVRLQKINWWAQECKNRLVASTPSSCSATSSEHPITLAIDSSMIDSDLFNQFIGDILSISQYKQITPNSAEYRWKWLIQAISPTINTKDSKTIANILFNYHNLTTLGIDFNYGYQQTENLPKYLNAEHLWGENPDVINKYLLSQMHYIDKQMQLLTGTPLPTVIAIQLRQIQSTLKKLKKSPKSIYNNQENLSPIRQLFISYFTKNKQVF